MGFSDPEIDRLVGVANTAESLETRGRALRGAVARAAQLRPILPLVVQREIVVFSRKIDWEAPVNLAFDFSRMRPAP